VVDIVGERRHQTIYRMRPFYERQMPRGGLDMRQAADENVHPPFHRLSSLLLRHAPAFFILRYGRWNERAEQ